MPSIILASASAARKRLLEEIGLKFKVIKSSVVERRKLTCGCAQLVKQNALAKASYVAARIKTGIVIGADTVVLDGQRVLGKPKDKKDAMRMINRLSKRPQWVYTGLALVDVDNQRKFVDYEKTKVFMHKLTSKEIKYYLKKSRVSKFAGSFDIQARGALFIRRVEGCFYNVVGLPLAKLYKMFKKAGISILVLVFCLNLAGCIREYNIATGREDLIFYSTEKEINLGRSISNAVERQFKLVRDQDLIKRLDSIGKSLAAVCDRRNLVYHFNVIDDKQVNAFALPGGFIYINKGLMDELDSDDELACILAHEIGHVVAKHSIKKLQAMLGYTVLGVLASQTTTPEFSQGVNIAFAQIMLGYSREDELLADKLAVKYAKLAGFNPDAMITVLQKLREIRQKGPIRPKSYARTHPYISYRIMMVKQHLGYSLTFDDYINKDTQ